MANIYYGFSNTESTESVKKVYVKDVPSTGLSEGDSITVYFARDNEVVAPTLEVVIDGLTTDAGNYIKTYDEFSDLDYMWRAGEMVLFTLTSQRFNSDINSNEDGAQPQTGGENSALYYYFVNGVKANEEFYGLTKLFMPEDIEVWINSQEEGERDSSVSPYLLKEVYKLNNVSYQSNINPNNAVAVGILKAGETNYEILVPNALAILNTSQLYNDADIVNGAHNRDNNPDSHFITNLLNEDLYFLDTPEAVALSRAIPTENESELTSPVVGNFNSFPFLTHTYENEISTIDLNNPDGSVHTKTNIYGYDGIDFYNNGGTTAASLSEGNLNVANSVAAPNFIENNIPLKEKYSGKLVRETYRSANCTLAAEVGGEITSFLTEWTGGAGGSGTKTAAGTVARVGSENSGHLGQTITKPGYRPLAIVGYNFNFGKDGHTEDVRFVIMWELYITNASEGSCTVQYAFSNISKQSRSISINFDILWEKIN